MKTSRKSTDWNLILGRIAAAIGPKQVDELHAYLPPEGTPSKQEIDHALLMAGVNGTVSSKTPQSLYLCRVGVAHQ